MKTALFAAILLSSFAGAAFAEGRGSDTKLTQWQLNEIAKRNVDSWFYYAAPATDAVFVTDTKGCLFSIHDAGSGINVVPVLDRNSRQHCRAPKQKVAGK